MTEKQEPIRDETGKFLPGHSGNPDGRPKGPTITEIIRSKLQEERDGKSVIDVLTEIILEQALKGNYKFLELIWNYIDGKPKQEIEMPVLGELDKLRAQLNKIFEDVKARPAKNTGKRKKSVSVPVEPVPTGGQAGQ